MKDNIRTMLSVFLLVLVSSCDSGDIYPEDKITKGTDIDVTASFQFSNIEAFPENYKIIFGSFTNDSPYPLSSKVIAKPLANEKMSVSLTNIPQDASYLGLYLVHEYSNQRIHPFYTYPLDGKLTQDIEIETQNINLASFKRIQKQVFSQCMQCHGGSGFAAAGLYLTDDKSYLALVDVIALRNPDKKIVSPQNKQNSYLIDILRGDALKNQHSSLSSLKDDDIILTEQWITDGAKND